MTALSPRAIAVCLLLALTLLALWLAAPRTAPPPQPARQFRTLLAPTTAVALDADLHTRLLQRGKRVYEACVACHLPSGAGIPGTNPPLIGSHVADAPAGRLIRAMIHGVEGPLTIDGEAYDGVMPPAQVETDDDLAAVLTYIRASWGNRGSPVTAAMVRAVREATASHEGHWSTADLDAIH